MSASAENKPPRESEASPDSKAVDSPTTVPSQLSSSSQSLNDGMEVVRKSLKSGVHSTVEKTNRFLSFLEDSVEKARQPVSKGLQEGSALSKKVYNMYERRVEFGPYLVLGSGVLFGGMVALRRGRVPGAFAGLVSGGLAYAFVYEPVSLGDVVESVTTGRRDG